MRHASLKIARCRCRCCGKTFVEGCEKAGLNKYQCRAYGYRRFANYRLRVLMEYDHLSILKSKFHIISD